MKKLLCVILALVFVLSLAACAKENGDASTPKETDATTAPTETEPAPTEAVVTSTTYVYQEPKEDLLISWEVILKDNGECQVNEVHPVMGTTKHVADGYTTNDDGTVTTGAWTDPDSQKSEFFAADGSCTWVLNDDGTCEPVGEGASSGDSLSIDPGKYTYGESKEDLTITWEVIFMANGECYVNEVHPVMGTTEHIADGFVVNADGTVTSGPWEDPDSQKSEFFAADGSCTWKINASDRTCEPVEGGASLSIDPGKYTYQESKEDLTITWEVIFMANGECYVNEVHPVMGTTEHIAEGFTVNEDGTVTSGPWEDPDSQKSEFFAADGSCTWKIDSSDRSCEPVG